jgi:hypothetical protein
MIFMVLTHKEKLFHDSETPLIPPVNRGDGGTKFVPTGKGENGDNNECF